MTYSIDPIALVSAAVALIVGLIIGFALRSGTKRRAVRLGEEVAVLSHERDGLIAERDALRLERDSLDERLRPLAAELDRLKRLDARRTATTAAAPVDMAADAPLAALEANDVRRLKGVGDRFASALAKLGITGIDQIAAWSGADADVIDSQLGSFAGRIRTDRLIEQARLLHEGRTTEYETRFGAL